MLGWSRFKRTMIRIQKFYLCLLKSYLITLNLFLRQKTTFSMYLIDFYLRLSDDVQPQFDS